MAGDSPPSHSLPGISHHTTPDGEFPFFSSTVSHPPIPICSGEGAGLVHPPKDCSSITGCIHSSISCVVPTGEGRQSEGGRRETTSLKVWLGYGVPRPLCPSLERPLRPHPPSPAFVGTAHSLWPFALHRWMLFTRFLLSPSSSCAGFRRERSGK